MKLLTTLFLLCSFHAFSQETFYAYREDWSNTTDLKEAKYFKHVVKEGDSYVASYYNINGPMLKMETYKDAALTMPLGRFIWYNNDGKTDSTGSVNGGRKDKYWSYYTHPDSINPTIYEKYEDGKFLWREDIINKRKTFADGRVVLTDSLEKKDTSNIPIYVQIEAKFPNGLKGWIKYLQKNLKTPERFEQLYPKGGRGVVVVAFMVDVDGSISDVHISRSAEWSVDKEAVRAIKAGPKWIPATQNGENVRYYQKQMITFVVSEE